MNTALQAILWAMCSLCWLNYYTEVMYGCTLGSGDFDVLWQNGECQGGNGCKI